MKLMIASDLHGSAYYTHQLLDAWDREGAPRLFLLGDILYHGPRNDLPEGYAPKEVLAMLNERKDRIFCVRGNCDGEVDQMVLDFPIMADYAVLTEGERLIYATHGRVQHCPPAAAAARRHFAAWPHPRARLARVWRGEPLPQPRLGLPPQRKQPPQLPDAGGRKIFVERTGWNGVP